MDMRGNSHYDTLRIVMFGLELDWIGLDWIRLYFVGGVSVNIPICVVSCHRVVSGVPLTCVKRSPV
jgi:hypothetical protein